MADEKPVDRQTFDDYREWLQFEHELINRRITWLLTSQSLLFAAIGLSIAPTVRLIQVIAGVGIAICMATLAAIVAAIAAKVVVNQDFAAWAKDESKNPERWGLLRDTNDVPLGVRTWMTRLGLAADVAIPLIFIVGWLLVLGFAGTFVDR